MNLFRLIALLFVLIGILASCAAAVALLALRFWPALLVAALAIGLFNWFLKYAGIHITSQR
ncbi:hypothetical protein [Pseudomonas aeruginosa]|uniref:hypothetical protein n=1 Tax=Pseudomonas aeruginosa TaxID=287 RepID=UPI001CC3CB4B|nr:hypothetical protein [Pseudomonas aeruginosa]MBZ5239757.1 hypothetical protein [Pseudomonas aeruginosa]MBZ5253141.1 hypothetical protein [Pseudomonas aeruginosa]